MPPQASMTATWTRPSSARRPCTRTVIPGSVCRMALATRLASARARSSGAPRTASRSSVGTSRSSRTWPEAAVAAASEATSVMSSVSDTSWDTFVAGCTLDAGQGEEVVDEARSSGPPCCGSGPRPAGHRRSRRPPVPPRGPASPASGVLRSWDMKLTSSCRDCSAARSRARDSANVRRVVARSATTCANSSGSSDTVSPGPGSDAPAAVRFVPELSRTSWSSPAPTCRDPATIRRMTR